MNKQTILKSTLCLLMAWVCNVAWAQAVIFPQEQQPGTAKVETVGDGYTIGNDLFTAKFVKADGKLTFGGCEELGLIAGSEIFKVTLGDGTEIPASEFTLGEVKVETLTGTSKEVKAARRYHGKQIKATFTHASGLTIEWRAVLRDGSHYLRTEMDILNSGAEGIAMNSITPMLYTVQNVDGEKAPAVVGNTRGAVIASDKIFAGVETPTAYNEAGEATDLDNFAFKSWTGAESFAWTPEVDDIPQGIKDLSQYGVGAVVGSRGYVIFREAGNTTITLTYTGSNDAGNCKLHILGVDIVSLTGTVLSGDYHYGTTGGSHSGNSYTVDIPEAGAYMVRYFISVKDEPIASKGNITYSKKVAQPELVYDLASTETPYINPEVTVVEDNTVPYLLSGMTYCMAANTKQSDGSFVPRYLYVNAEGNLATATECDESNVNYKWTLEANGSDAWYIKNGGGKYLSYNANSNTARLKVDANKYSFKLIDEAVEKGLGIYSLYNPTSSGGKYMCTKADGSAFDQGSSKTNNGSWCSDYLFTTCPKKLNSETTEQKDYWTNQLPGFVEWNGELPEGVTFTGTQKRAMDKYYSIAMGKLTVSYQYTGSSHRLYPLGVQLLDLQGNVVSEHFRNGATGASNAEAYNVTVPQDGIYAVRYIVERFGTTDGWESQGTITLTFASIDCGNITGEQSPTEQWERELPGYTNWGGTLPDGVTKKGTAQYRDSYYVVKAGKLSLTFDYTEGQGHNHALNVLGVQLLDHNGKVVSSEFKNGKSGTNTTVTYTVNVVREGLYTVRHIVDKGTNDGWHTAGTITYNIVETKILGTINEDETLADAWRAADWKTLPEAEIPNRVNEVGCSDANARVIEQQITITAAGVLSVEFVYGGKDGGGNKLNLVGVDLLDATGQVAVDDYHAGETGNSHSNNVYKLNVFSPGVYTIRYFANNGEVINNKGDITLKLKVDYTLHLIAPATTPLVGKWSRITTLKADEEWNISAVVGVIAPGQARRSFLCYSERERAVPWRAVPAYISWYEVNIDRNNAAPGSEHIDNMTADECLPILREWKTQLYDKYGEAPYAFVWDDGWDEYGEWQFHEGFPNGFTDMDNIGREMGAGQGAWLGPVGGYGTSGGYRRNYWTSTKTGGMQLSNPLYYDVFVKAVTGLLRDKGYDFRFFKFDGISAQFSSVGPDAGATGNENAEAIIMAEKVLRGIKEDVFLNTTVGTWASPFWFQHTDAIWRQEKDYGEIGNNSNDRENWITYRDRLVYQNFVQNSPLCPINTLMTHGFIFTNFSEPASTSRDWYAVVRELRCAFACGSGMVELYNDYELTNNLVNPATGKAGELWGEIAKCMKWQRKNADVLPDIHWVGGNPWTGAKAEVYGWAAWNGPKAVLTLRNGANDAQDYTFTLREALDIPAYVKTSITLTKAFEDQAALEGLPKGPINIDTELTVKLPGSSVYIFDGAHEVAEGDTEDNTPAATISAVIGEYEIGTFYANEAVSLPEGVNAYVANQTPVADIEEADGYTITMTKIGDGIIPAKTGVVIRGEMGTYNFTTTTSVGTTDTEGNLMKGYAGVADYQTITLPDPKDSTIYVLNVKKGDTEARFYKKEAEFPVYNHRAYLQVPNSSTEVGGAQASAPVLRIRYAGQTTELESIVLDARQGSALFYDLQGRRVENPTKGIYIVNGKKVIF